MPSRALCEPFPPAERYVGILRVEFSDAGDPSSSLRGQNRRSTAAERIHEIATASRMQRVDAGIVENVRTVPALAPESEIVDVRRRPVLKNEDQFVLGSVEAALAGV